MSKLFLKKFYFSIDFIFFKKNKFWRRKELTVATKARPSYNINLPNYKIISFKTKKKVYTIK